MPLIFYIFVSVILLHNLNYCFMVSSKVLHLSRSEIVKLSDSINYAIMCVPKDSVFFSTSAYKKLIHFVSYCDTILRCSSNNSRKNKLLLSKEEFDELIKDVPSQGWFY